ncbi:TPA: hypothetical protein ACH3X1_013210 [Trebouxia sp. C0004]
MGWSTPSMLANFIKYGDGNIVLLDATFGTNHMKMPLYTGLVIDEYGNGLPAFMILCQGTTQIDLSAWLRALLQRVREHAADWMCSCIMVDDALAEINAIREVFGPYGVLVFLCFWHVKRSWLKILIRKCPRAVRSEMFNSLERIMLMVRRTNQSRVDFTQQVKDAIQTFYDTFKDEQEFVAYFQKHWGHKFEEWVRGFCEVNHTRQDTTGACEGFHSAIKGDELAMKTRLQGRRVDWLLWLLWNEVDLRFQRKQAYKAAGFVTNRRQEQAVASAVVAAQRIPDNFVKLLDSSGQLAEVTSMQDSSVKYEVKAAGIAAASCTCPNAQLHFICKHMMKVVSLTTQYSGAQIIQALGTRAGSTLQGFDKLQCKLSNQSDNSNDQMAQLEQQFALDSSDDQAKPAAKSQQITEQVHDSSSCPSADG